MKLHSILRNVALLIAVACLVLAYLPLVGPWLIPLAILAVLALGSITRTRSVFWAASGLLGAYMVLCVMAILLSRPLVVVILGCLAALLWWDLSEFSQGMAQQAQNDSTDLLEKYRLRSLAMAMGVSLPLEAVGLWLRLQLPFGVIAGLALLVLGFILYSNRLLSDAAAKHTRQH